MDQEASAYGKWFARIGHDSVRELPVTVQQYGEMKQIIGYCYSPTGITKAAVSNVWYPVLLTEFLTAEYATLDAWLASEYGQSLLSGCGVSSLITVGTAVQHLAENGIDITLQKAGMYYRTTAAGSGLYSVLVRSNGRVAVMITNGVPLCMRCSINAPGNYTAISVEDGSVGYLVSAFGTDNGTEVTLETGSTVVYDDVTYQMTVRQGETIQFNPNPTTYAE